MRVSRLNSLLVALLAAAALLAAGALLTASSDAAATAKARAEAAVAVLPDGPVGRVSATCTPSRSSGCGRRGTAATQETGSVVRLSSGEGELDVAVGSGDATAEATAVARSVSLLDGLVTAYGVRRRAQRAGERTERSGRVNGLVVGGQRIGTVLGRRTFTLPDGVGELRVNDRDAGLRIVLARDVNGLRAGDEVIVARVSVATRDGEVDEDDDADADAGSDGSGDEPDPTATPDDGGDTSGSGDDTGGDGDDDGGSGDSSPDATATPRATASPKPTATPERRRAPSVQQRLTGQNFAFPVFGDNVTIADDFGGPRQIGPHQGNDIFAAFGAPVLAVADGTVTKVGTLPISGNRLWLRTKEGDAFFYAHLSAFSAEAVSGREVKAGTVLGFTGNTGDAEPTPPHVHFEIHPGGINRPAIDPHPFLLAWREGRDVPPGAWLSRYGTDTEARPGALVEVDDFIARQGG